jgi:hypothetical protein
MRGLANEFFWVFLTLTPSLTIFCNPVEKKLVFSIAPGGSCEVAKPLFISQLFEGKIDYRDQLIQSFQMKVPE